MVHKPERWAVNAAGVDPEWQWAWRGLEFIVPFFDVDPSTSWEAHNRSLMANTTADAAQVITPYGVACSWPNTQVGFEIMPWAKANATFNGLSEATFWFFGTLTTAGSGRRGLAKTTGTSGGELLLGTLSGGNFRLSLNNQNTTGGRLATLEEPSHWFGQFKESTGTVYSAIESEEWLLVQGPTNSPGATLSWSDTNALCVGGKNAVSVDTARNWYGYQWIAAGWSRALTETEMQMLARDPFGPIRPRRLPVTPADVSTPTNPIVIDHDFNSSNGAPWPPPWVDDSVSGGTVDIQSGVGRLTDGGTDQEARTYSSEISDSVEMTFRIRAYGTGDYRCDAGFMVGTTWQSAGEDPQNGYYLWCTDGAAPALYRVVGGSYQLLDGTVGADFGTNWYWFRMRYDSTDGRLQVRQWLDGTAEPGDWDADVTDSNHQGSTFRAFFTHYAPANDGIYVDNITVTDLTANTYRSDSFRTKVFVP